MKKKTITLVVYMLVCISLVSVGFAAWIITGGDETSASGNVNATNVTDLSLQIDRESWDDQADSGSIVFGRPSTDYTTGWLYAEAGDAVEKLNATYTFTLSMNGENNTNTIGGLITNNIDKDLVKITFKHSTAVQNAVAAGYIKGVNVLVTINYTDKTDSNPKTLTVTQEITSNTTVLEGDNIQNNGDLVEQLSKINATTATISIKISYMWGQTFGSVNPYDFYNTVQNGNYEIGDTGTTYIDHAKLHLQGLYTTLYGSEDQTSVDRSFDLIIQIGAEAPAENQ